MNRPTNTKRRGIRRHFSQEGVALLAVAVATSLVGVLVAEFSTNTNVDMFAATNAADDMKLHFMARSGMNLGQLMIRVQTRILDPLSDQFKMDIQLGDYAGLFMGAFGGSKEEVEGVAALLGGFAARDMKGLGIPEGRFDVQITTEDNKINLNCAGGSVDTQKFLQFQLSNLFFPKEFDALFQDEDAEGWRRDRDTQVSALIDYVDRDHARMGAPGAPEDYGYESLNDKYKAKDRYLDSVGEIKLIRGVDDRFWALFGDSFSVHGGCQVNISALDNPMLIASLILSAAKEENEPRAITSENLLALAQIIVMARGLGYTFYELNAFTQFVQDPQSALGPSELLPPELSTLLQNVVGVQLNTQTLNKVATAGKRRTYRVEATAVLGDDDNPNQMTKRIVGVWDTRAPNTQNTRAPGNVEPSGSQDHFGYWVFWREE